jgi:hypothetical protein
MQALPLGKRILYRVFGTIFYWTYVTDNYSILGLSLGWIVRRLLFVPVLLGLLGRWGQWTWLLLGVALLVSLVYWYAARVGYSRFVVKKEDTGVALAGKGVRPLPANEKVAVQATGLFSVRDSESFVLLQPAHYWQVPLGDHVVMVEHMPKSYVYQFFDAAGLQQVQEGWLIFGRELREALAVTFRTKWAPQFAQFEIRYYLQDDVEPEAPLRTIYLSFANEADKQAVWHNIVQAGRQERA